MQEQEVYGGESKVDSKVSDDNCIMELPRLREGKNYSFCSSKMLKGNGIWCEGRKPSLSMETK
jgi:hypothetical protein